MHLLYPHQLKAIDEMHNGCILWGGVGTGKTMTAAGYYVKKEAPRDVYVITTAKKRDDGDWLTEFARFGVSTSPQDSLQGVVTVDSWNKLKAYEAVEDAFFIFDEQRLVGSGSWTKAFLLIAKRNRWVLLSATPGDTWLDYVPVFIANGYYKNRTEFKQDHVIYRPYTKFPQVDRYVGTQKLERLRRQVLVEMPFRSHTTRVDRQVVVEYNRELVKSVLKNRWNPYENAPIENVSQLFHILRRVINSDTSRLRALEAILSDSPRVIVFYSFDYELELLRGLSERYTVAEWNSHKHEPVPCTDEWVYLVQYTAGAEGWNCIKTDTMVFYSQTYSYKILEQAHGRIDRLNTPYQKLTYYHLISKAGLDLAIRKALRSKQNFNERAYRKDL